MSQRYQGGFVTASYNGLKVPNAPTIGTATGGDASASVTFTAPVDVGGGAITGYTVTSSPTGITGTGSSSPITVSGLSNGTAYTFTVVATNAFGTSVASAASDSVTPAALVIGQAYSGGYFAGKISTAGNGVADYNLVIGPVASAQNTARQWKNAQTTTPGANSVINGPQNTADIVADGNSSIYPAAWFCDNLTIGGFSDWYLPAKNELEICYYNLKPTTTSNVTYAGANANAVPTRNSNYTAGTPAQTSAADFKDTGAEDFITNYYWSSTDYGDAYAWNQTFSNGNQDPQFKNYNMRVRATRRVAI
jgi:hypothetical protein